MKTTIPSALGAALLIASLFGSASSARGQANRIPAVPLGTLDAFPTIVQTGTKPTLTWGIMYPSKVSDVAVISPPGTLIPNQQIYVSVQPVGTGFVGCTDNPQPVNPQPPAEARVSFNGGTYQQLFYGVLGDVDPSKRLYVKKMKAGETLDFGGSYVVNGAWTPFYTTRSSNLQVIALVNGATIPTTLPLYQRSFLANYLRPYLDGTGKVKLGPMSVLILMELNTTDHNQSCFDYQDMVLLVTFSTKNNNGHGNNLDGVDVSNPGGGKGGPNGRIDPSGGVDDEKK